jgi:transcriptional regulator with XRE-family HTH domain
MRQSNDVLLKLIGGQIYKARTRLGITQDELAARTGKTQDAISNYENGKRNFRVIELPGLAKALCVPIAYFFGELPPEKEFLALLAEFPPERREEVLARLRFEVEWLRRNAQGKKEK